MRRSPSRSPSSVALGVAAAVAAVVVALGVLPPPAAAVVGGDEAEPGEWPWQVVLRDGGEPYCGGALVALDVVLTAAHCTDGIDPDDITVVAGVTDLADSAAQVADVERIDEHEDYDPVEVENDIALLHLAEALTPGDGVAPVALPDAAVAAALAAHGAPTTVTGFGATTEDGPMHGVLLEAEVAVVDDPTCIGRYAEDGDEVFAPTNLCAGIDRGHVDACFGDSGGPLVAASGGGDDWYLVGIVSWGAGCGRPLRPTVYTEVAAYAGWLADHGALAPVGERFESTGTSRLRLPAAGTRGKASRYPDLVEVDGFDGEVASVAVELHGLTHERADDLDIWLVAPDGTTVTLLSDLGGAGPVVGVDLVVVPDGPAPTGGPLPLRFGPGDAEPDDQLRGDAPPADLGELAGVEPEGEWQLRIADDREGARGHLDGWTLVLVPA